MLMIPVCSLILTNTSLWLLTEMLPQSAASMRSGEDQSQAHADASPWGGHEKRQQYLSHLWRFSELGTMLSLWCGFISLQPQPRMVAVLWWPLHKSVLVLSLGNVAGWELDKRRTRRESGEIRLGRSWRQTKAFHRKIDWKRLGGYRKDERRPGYKHPEHCVLLRTTHPSNHLSCFWITYHK